MLFATYASFRILPSTFPWISVFIPTAIVTRNVGNPANGSGKTNKEIKRKTYFFVGHNCDVSLASMNAGTETYKAAEIRYIFTPSKSIKVFLVCGDIEYFDNFQVQQYSFHHHPSKGNEVKVVYRDGNSYTHRLRREERKRMDESLTFEIALDLKMLFL